ncbi:MAG: YdiU family protein [Cyclobacteriaceae bacterium]|nr:YdiU family protein [Cyclobacteriaceae bacterium]MCH8515987.1 YdiU family protein [Cyclobacteriaceae bacterium]
MIDQAIHSLEENVNFDNSYTQLPTKFFAPTRPTVVKKPQLMLFNEDLAAELGLETWKNAPEAVAAVLSGNELLSKSKPYAMAYAGHQFGGFTMLGDGRAIMIGEQITPTGDRKDIQLKGAGITKYSRSGDGRSTLYSMLREYLMGEAMYHLGIPSSRGLAVVATGEKVMREQPLPGAVFTRVMKGHIRVGTFEYARQFASTEEQQAFLEYVVNRHYPDLVSSENLALALIRQVMEVQAELVVNWERIGFIHGVMNTDNMSISGETFDYGPCAFMNAYHKGTVFSSIDRQGRYAFGNQSPIAHWNLACLAGALLPLIDQDEKSAIAAAQDQLNAFPALHHRKWTAMMRKKLGLLNAQPDDATLAEQLLAIMQQYKMDYTNTFMMLQTLKFPKTSAYESNEFQEWLQQYRERIKQDSADSLQRKELMQQVNPVLIPRNHKVEEALKSAAEKGDFTPFNELLEALKKPYEYEPLYAHLQYAPSAFDQSYQTFCGT